MTAWDSTMKMTQRQSQKMLLKQIPGMVTVLKLRERLFSASERDLEDFLLRFMETNRYLLRSENRNPVDAVIYPRFHSSISRRERIPPDFSVDNRSVTDILESTAAVNTTLKSTLTEQLHLERLSHREIEIGELLISGLDDNGFWICDPETGETFLESEKKRQPQNAVLLERLTAVIRRLDPPGAAVKNRFESAAVIAADNPDDYTEEAVRFYRRLFELTENGTDWNLIPQLLNEEFGVETVTAIGRLPIPQPPGTGFEPIGETIPDATVVIEGQRVISVSVPADRLLHSLRLSDNTAGNSDDARELRTAEAVLYAVRERCRLLKEIAASVSRRQLAFIIGDTSRKTRVTQAEIAEAIGIDRPKLSRLIKNKFIEIKLKDEGSDSVMQSRILEFNLLFDRSGTGSRSRSEIITAIQLLLQKHGSLTDDQLSRLLKLQGIGIHRRTVCKYRSQINTLFSGGNYGTIHSRDSLRSEQISSGIHQQKTAKT